MEPELERRLQNTSKKHLIQLLQELATRHPLLLAEMASILEISLGASDAQDAIDEEITEDWDFGGDEPTMLHPMPRTTLPPLDIATYRQRFEAYATRLSQGEPAQSIAEELAELLEEAELRAEHQDYYDALELYALIFDERLLERVPALTPILDEALDVVTPALETLLSEASGNALFDTTAATPAPLLTADVRHRWLEYLFALWLKRLDTSSVEEYLPDLMLNVAWSEDIPLLRSLVQNELSQHPRNEHSNIVDFKRQYRTRTLEKFLRELPHT